MPAQQIEDRNAIADGIVWVRLTYPDGSEFCFQTTLNPAILRDRGVNLEEGRLVRLDKKYYWNEQYVYRQFPHVGSKITMWDTCCYSHAPSRALHDFM